VGEYPDKRNSLLGRLFRKREKKRILMDSLLPKSKVCNKCGEEKLLEEFNKHNNKKYGRQDRCKVCCKQYYQENKERIAEKNKRYREANKEKIVENQKQYREANKEELARRQIEKMKYLTENDLLPKSRVCTKCGEEKLLGEFYKQKGGTYGRTSQCNLCSMKRQKQYEAANKEKRKEINKRYREANREKLNERKKQYNQENKEKRKQYYEANKQKIAEQTKQYYEANKEKLVEWKNEWTRNRRKNDEQFRIRNNLSGSLRKVLNRIGKTKNASILTYIGCSVESLQEHLNSTKKPDWGDDLHIDHIIPSSLFDHTNEEEIKKCWNWRNLRYLPAKENISKHDTLDMDLVKSYGIEDLLPVGVDK
jgi:hypothetical protein